MYALEEMLCSAWFILTTARSSLLIAYIIHVGPPGNWDPGPPHGPRLGGAAALERRHWWSAAMLTENGVWLAMSSTRYIHGSRR
jgi:hypothetical protein